MLWEGSFFSSDFCLNPSLDQKNLCLDYNSQCWWNIFQYLNIYSDLWLIILLKFDGRYLPVLKLAK